jgi:hypothetical protein
VAKQLAGVGLVLVAQRKHLAMHDAFASGEPLHIAIAKAGRGPQRVGVVNAALAHDGDGFKAPVRMRWKARNGLAVVHAPAVFVAKVAAHLPPCQGGVRPHLGIAFGVMVQVVHTKQKRVHGLPWKRQGRNFENAGRHG